MNTFSRFNIATSENSLKSVSPRVSQKGVDDKLQLPYFDAFIQENEKQSQKQNTSIGFFQALGSGPTLGIPMLLFACYQTFAGVKLYNSVKKIPKESKKILSTPLFKSYAKNFLGSYIALLALSYCEYKLCARTKDKYLKREQDKIEKFNNEFKSNIKFSPLSDSSGSIVGGMNPMTATLSVDGAMLLDPISRLLYLPATVDHELIHAKQYLMIARLDNSMEKMNLIIVKRLAKNFGVLEKFVINNLKKEIDNGVPEKYANAKIKIEGREINLVDYVNAIHTAIHNPNCSEKDIPIIVNKEFYESVKKLGPLSKEEKIKAEAYLDAYKNYPSKISLLPNSKYRKNLLEKEAFSIAPWYFI